MEERLTRFRGSLVDGLNSSNIPQLVLPASFSFIEQEGVPTVFGGTESSRPDREGERTGIGFAAAAKIGAILILAAVVAVLF
jgi:hypothetical protein